MRFEITSYGALRAAWRIQGLAASAADTRPAMEEIYFMILEIEDEIFESQGQRGGRAGWEPLSVGWINWKVNHGKDYRILHMDRHLRDSVSRYRHPSQFARLTKDKILFKSKLPYAEIHQKGSGVVPIGFSEVPKREYIYFTKTDAMAFASEIKKHIVSVRSGGPSPAA